MGLLDCVAEQNLPPQCYGHHAVKAVPVRTQALHNAALTLVRTRFTSQFGSNNVLQRRSLSSRFPNVMVIVASKYD
jgi:hypothetical protein